MPLIWELLDKNRDKDKPSVKEQIKAMMPREWRPPEPKKHDAFALVEPIEEIAEIMEERSAVEV